MKENRLTYNGRPAIPYTITSDRKIFLVPVEDIKFISFDDLNFLVLEEGGEELDDNPHFDDD